MVFANSSADVELAQRRAGELNLIGHDLARIPVKTLSCPRRLPDNDCESVNRARRVALITLSRRQIIAFRCIFGIKKFTSRQTFTQHEDVVVSGQLCFCSLFIRAGITRLLSTSILSLR